ncbi:J domain-containing protein [Sulfitobacter pontiacus]|uniref:J domain-containing protein n=1 Tax=Sulfitobacter pontiacus TaxID=60137 RepID=UPI003BF49D41
MYLDLFRGIFSWAGGITDVLSALRSRSAYEDIRRLEREIEALKSQLRASQTSPATPGGSAQQASWRAQAQARKAASTSRSTGSSSGKQRRRRSSGGGSHKAQSRVKDGPTGGQKSSTGQSSGNSGSARPNGSQSGSRQQGTSQSQSGQQSTGTGASGGYQISAALRDRYLQTLELMPGKTYTQAELKTAWRKMAFKTHPDKGGSAAAFSAVQEAYKALT